LQNGDLLSIAVVCTKDTHSSVNLAAVELSFGVA